jgi:hypothetical protein
METPDKKSKSVIPRSAQIVLIIVGIPLLLFFGFRMAREMGWISTVPQARRVAKAKPTPGAQPTTGAPAGTTQPTAVAPPPRPGPTKVADLGKIVLPPGRDPMADLRAAPAPTPPGTPPGGPAGPARAPSAPPPVLPSPLPPPSVGPFPSPTTTGPAVALPPQMRPAQPAPRPLPPALAVSYPIVRRGVPSRAPSVALVGTISSKSRSLAVVRSTDTEGARGRYVRPGESIDRQGHQVKTIGPGTITLSGRGGSRQLGLPGPPSTTGPGAGKGKTPAGGGIEEASPSPSPATGGGEAATG